MNKFVAAFSVMAMGLCVSNAVAQNVGIGQASPSSRLEIRGSGTTNATSSLHVTDNAGVSVLLVTDDHRVGIRNTAPDASAVLDITATDAGVLIPRVTDGQMNGIANPATGLLVYNSSQNLFFYYDGTQWISLVNTNGQNNNNQAGDPTLIYTTDGF